MTKTKINKQDKEILSILLLIGFIAQFFIESGMSIAVLCFFMYMFHKYISTTKNIKEYDRYEFRDEDSYNRGRKLFLKIIDIYIVLRIISVILKPQSSYVLGEMLLIIIIYSYYEKYLNKKYVISTNILEEESDTVFARRKILLSIGMIVFIGFSIFTINTFNKVNTENHIKYGKYEYKISNTEGIRNIEVNKLASDYMKINENNESSSEFDKIIENIKSLMKKQIIKSYLFLSMIILLILCFIEIYPKEEKIKSRALGILCIIAISFGIVSFNIDVTKDEMDLSSDFHNYMGRVN